MKTNLSECAEILEIADSSLENTDAATELASVTSNLVGVNLDLMTMTWGLSRIANFLESLGFEAEDADFRDRQAKNRVRFSYALNLGKISAGAPGGRLSVAQCGRDVSAAVSAS